MCFYLLDIFVMIVVLNFDIGLVCGFMKFCYISVDILFNLDDNVLKWI